MPPKLATIGLALAFAACTPDKPEGKPSFDMSGVRYQIRASKFTAENCTEFIRQYSKAIQPINEFIKADAPFDRPGCRTLIESGRQSMMWIGQLEKCSLQGQAKEWTAAQARAVRVIFAESLNRCQKFNPEYQRQEDRMGQL